MMPDDWLSDAENSTPGAFDNVLCTASIRLRDGTDQLSTIREYMPYFQGNHAFPAVVGIGKTHYVALQYGSKFEGSLLTHRL
jgi:hypothetical protein